MRVPRVGGDNNQPKVDPTQAIPKKCECGSEYFEVVLKLGVVSRFAPGNTANQDVIMQTPVYVCHGCGKTLNLLGDKATNDAEQK